MKKWEYLAVDLFAWTSGRGSTDEKRFRCMRLDTEQGCRGHFVKTPEPHILGTQNTLEKPLLEWLNEFGEEGWEMVTLTRDAKSRPSSGSSGRYTFKREVV
jgi:hypothetical protein